MTAAPAFAQENDDEDQEDAPVQTTQQPAPQAAPGETIVVTGSRIRRDAFTSTAPLQVIDSEDIRDAGLVDVGQILSQTSVAQGIQLDNTITSGGFVTDGGPGAQNVSLRGLSADRTLALINGRRFAAAGIGGAPSLPDTNLIPSSMIQRIDILLDGASSVYGSDAVAGVINVVLRDSFEGIQADAFVSVPESSGGGGQRYNVLMGGSSDGSNYLFAVEYYAQERMRVRDRDYHLDPDSGYYCQKRIVRDASGNLNSFCSGAIINRVCRGVDLYSTPGETNLPGIVPPGWSSVVALGTDGASTSLLPQFQSTYMDENTDIIPQSQRYSMFFTGDTDLNPIFGWDGINLFAEASYTNSQTTRKTDYSGQLFPVVGADNPFNPFGVTVQPIVAFPVERSTSRAEI
jgi:iron complex outermembrane recepter protein